MKKTLIFAVVFILTTACAQQKNKTNMNTNTAKQVTSSSQQETHPGYYLQINNQNCYYELNTNGLRSGIYYGEYPVYSIRIPLNLQILKSGEQSLSLKVFPYKGDTLSPKANLQMRLIKYADMTDLENEYGGSTVLWNWEMPEIGEQHLPLFAYDTIFKAEVPYTITTLDTKATDLSKIDRDKLLEEVIAEFTKTRASIINKTQDVDMLNKSIKRLLTQLYEGDKFKKEVIGGMINLGDGKEPQPLENFEMRLYYHNRVVTLVKNDDKEPAIWFKHPETGARSWQPVYIYKDNTTGKWERW
ncbi:hypothetical protein [Aquimarina longa]|uniref:hypothetical protein n=1 Tax=Aquimarina longa TaxID=1080221 RepID=UPI000782DAC0|nr:hypothetical protein [Aquimarina longa]